MTSPDMIEATRLTRQGRLGEATALLQALFRGKAAANTADHASRAYRRWTHQPAVAASCKAEEANPASPAPPAPRSGTDARPVGATGRDGPTADCPSHCDGLLGKLKHGGLAGPSPMHPPAPLPDGARFVAATFSSDDGSRAYKLYIPSQYRGEPVPLVVMLHGCTQSPDDFAAGTRMNELAEERVFLVAYPAQPASRQCPEMLELVQPGRPGPRPGRACVDRGHHPPGHARARDRPGPRLCRRAIGRRCRGRHHGRSLSRSVRRGRRAFRPRLRGGPRPPLRLRRHAPGGATAPRRSGAPPRTEAPDRIVPTIVFHADRDTTVHPANGDHVIAQVAASAGSGTPIEQRTWPSTRRAWLHADRLC